jgi:hypothetical protein
VTVSSASSAHPSRPRASASLSAEHASCPARGHPLADELTALGFPRGPTLLSFSVDRLTAELPQFEAMSVRKLD